MKDRETDFSVIADYYKKHYEEVQLFVAKQLKQRGQEAEDIVQNVFGYPSLLGIYDGPEPDLRRLAASSVHHRIRTLYKRWTG